MEEIISAFFLLVTTVLVLINIITRYFLNTGIYWSEEVATGSFVWAVFMGAAAAYKKNQHIGIDLLVSRLSDKSKSVLDVFISFILLFLLGFIAFTSMKYVSTTLNKPTPVLNISSAYISSVIPVSFFIMTLRTVESLIKELKRGENI